LPESRLLHCGFITKLLLTSNILLFAIASISWTLFSFEYDCLLGCCVCPSLLHVSDSRFLLRFYFAFPLPWIRWLELSDNVFKVFLHNFKKVK
jgi:hypothetical protein